jgi:glycine betaine/proline transport system substrate-binding protein
MSDRVAGRRLRALFSLVVAAAIATSLVGGGSALGGQSAASCGKVVLNEQAWAGSTANTYIAKYVLEKRLGCEVEVTKVTEIPAFQAMADGKVDLVLEDWQHVDQYQQYITKGKKVQFAGRLGVVGHIGWYIPKYLLQQYPQFKSWQGLKGKESVFGGEFLGGDPSYVQKDKELIKALGLDLRHVTAGAEPAQVARWTTAYKRKRPVIFYWYTPQYLNQQYELAEVKLPPRFKSCKDDAKAGGSPAQYRCAYGVTVIMKLMSSEFASSGSPAVAFAKRFTLTNADQELVAKWIAGDKLNAEKAGEKWVKANPGKVKKWLG